MTDPGLCGDCRHCRLVDSGRSVFYLCERSRDDARYRKYPPIPVCACTGYDPRRLGGDPGGELT